MKRVLILIVVFVLLLGGAVFFLTGHGVTDGAQLVPADSVLYVSVPDVERTKERWPKTALGMIRNEPSVAAVLEKPLAQLSADGSSEASDLFNKVNPKRLFFAVTALSETNTQVEIGFEYSGGRQNLDAAMDRLYHEVGKRVPEAKTTTSDYKGDTVTTIASSAPILFSASHGSWGFIANTQAGIQQLLDRASRREASASLSASEGYKTVLGQLSKNPDFLWYGQLQQVVDLLVEVGKKQQATANAKQFDQLRKIKAVGGSLLFDGLDQKEVTYLLYPDAPKIPVIDRSAMALTSTDTMLFYDASADWKTLGSDEYLGSLPPAAQAFLTNAKIDLKQLPDIFGNDIGFMLNWAPNDGIPAALLSVEVKDRPKAESMLTSLLSAVGSSSAPTQQNGASVFPVPGLKAMFVDPVLGLTDKALILSLTPPGLDRALSAKPGDKTLESSPAFKPALPVYQGSVQAFGYVDSKAIFERIYNMVRPLAIIAGSMSPDVGKVVDMNKLPETDAISKHLNPILYTTKQLSDGMLIESSGPITLSQAAVLVGGGVGGAYMSKMMGGGL